MSFSTSARFSSLKKGSPSPATYQVLNSLENKNVNYNNKSTNPSSFLLHNKCDEFCGVSLCCRNFKKCSSSSASSKRCSLDPNLMRNLNRNNNKENNCSKAEKKNSNLISMKPLNVSYTIVPKKAEKPGKSEAETEKLDEKIESKREEKTSLLKMKIFEKTQNLMLNSAQDKKFYDLSSAMEIYEEPKCFNELLLFDTTEEEDCELIFLVVEEFIDDNYVEGLTENWAKKLYSRNMEFFEMVKDLSEIKFMNQNNHGATTKKANKKNTRKKFTKEKNSRKIKQFDELIQQAFEAVAKEFHDNIQQITVIKLEQLINDLKTLNLKSHNNIDAVCTSTAKNLIASIKSL